MVSLEGFGGGMAGGAVVSIVIKATDEFSGVFDKASESTGHLSGAMMGMTGALTAGISVVGGLAEQMGEFAIKAAEAGDVQEAFNKLAGDDATTALNAMNDASLHTISNMDLMKAANDALFKGMSTQDLPVLTKFSQQLADMGKGKVTDNMGAISQALATGRTAMLKTMGVNVDAQKVYDDLAASLGTTTDKLDDASKAAALHSAIIEGLTEASKKLPEPVVDAGDAVKQMSKAWEDAQVKMGDAIGPMITDINTNLMPVFKDLMKFVEEHIIPSFEALFNSVKDLMGQFDGSNDAVNTLVKGLGYIIEGLIVFTALVIKGVATVLGFINVAYEWAGVIKDVLVAAFHIAKDEFSLFINAAETGWEMMKLSGATAANFIIDLFENAFNKVIGFINKMIDAANAASNALGGGDIMSRLTAFDFSGAKVDTSQITANLRNLSGERQQLVNDIKINIENITGMNPDDIAKALKTSLTDLVSP